MSEREEFGPALRRERERRGITLRDIAAQTKISPSLLEAMERNDFRRWPGGIFRRSFVRSYARVVGLDDDRVVSDFVRLFPLDEEGVLQPAAPPAAIGGVGGQTTGVSIREPRSRLSVTWLRVVAVLLLVAGGASVIAVGARTDQILWVAAGGTAVILSLGLALIGRARPEERRDEVIGAPTRIEAATSRQPSVLAPAGLERPAPKRRPSERQQPSSRRRSRQQGRRHRPRV